MDKMDVEKTPVQWEIDAIATERRQTRSRTVRTALLFSLATLLVFLVVGMDHMVLLSKYSHQSAVGLQSSPVSQFRLQPRQDTTEEPSEEPTHEEPTTDPPTHTTETVWPSSDPPPEPTTQPPNPTTAAPPPPSTAAPPPQTSAAPPPGSQAPPTTNNPQDNPPTTDAPAEPLTTTVVVTAPNGVASTSTYVRTFQSSVASPSNGAEKTSGNDSGPSAAVIGGAVGGAIVFLILLALLIFFLYRRKKNREPRHSYAEKPSPLPDFNPPTHEPTLPNVEVDNINAGRNYATSPPVAPPYPTPPPPMAYTAYDPHKPKPVQNAYVQPSHNAFELGDTRQEPAELPVEYPPPAVGAAYGSPPQESAYMAPPPQQYPHNPNDVTPNSPTSRYSQSPTSPTRELAGEGRPGATSPYGNR